MSEVARSNTEMLDLVHRLATAIRQRRRRRIVVSIKATVAVVLVGLAVVVIRRPDGHQAVVPGSSSTAQTSVAETSPASSAQATVPSTAPSTTTSLPPADERVVEPIGTVGGRSRSESATLRSCRSRSREKRVRRSCATTCGSTTTPADEVAPSPARRRPTTGNSASPWAVGPSVRFRRVISPSSTPTSS